MNISQQSVIKCSVTSGSNDLDIFMNKINEINCEKEIMQ